LTAEDSCKSRSNSNRRFSPRRISKIEDSSSSGGHRGTWKLKTQAPSSGCWLVPLG